MRIAGRAGAFLVIWLMAVTPLASAHEAPSRPDQTAPESGPRLGAFINIWLEAHVQNLEPAVAYNSRHDEYLVVWSNMRGGGAWRDIYARRVRADGTLLSYFTVAHNAGFHNYQPDVAYSPTHDEYLIVFTYDSVVTDSDIWARRVLWDGSWMSSEFAVGRKTDRQTNPAVTYNTRNDEYLVVYQNTWAGGGQDIDAERVRAEDGTPLGWVNIAAGPGSRIEPDVDHNPVSNRYLIAYTFQSGASPADIYSKASSWNMGQISAEHHICDDTNHQGRVAVAVSGEEFLAVWEDSPSASTTEIYARRLDPFGTPLGPPGGFWITGNPGRHDQMPSVAGGAGFGHLVVWRRLVPGKDHDVLGRYVAPFQDVAAGSEFFIDNDIRTQTAPTVACVSYGACLVAEEDNNSAGGDFEIRGRLVWLMRSTYLPQVLRIRP
jgi:hypothetical protein